MVSETLEQINRKNGIFEVT